MANTNTKTIKVPHLNGISAGYQLPHPYDPSKPTLVLINSFQTSSDLYRSQFQNKALTDSINLLAIDLLGHGLTRTKSEHFTYWDTAIMNLQVLTALGIEKAFVLGTSQGGWVTARMALLAPERILGIIPLGSTMDSESLQIRERGCWDGSAILSPAIVGWSSPSTETEFDIGEDYCNFLVASGFNTHISDADREFWVKATRENYLGEEGRKRTRMAAINLRDRDGLLGRIGDIKAPVLWLHGTEDQVYSAANAKEEIELFTGAKAKELVVVEGGAHFLSASHPKKVDGRVLEFVKKWSGGS